MENWHVPKQDDISNASDLFSGLHIDHDQCSYLVLMDRSLGKAAY